MGINTLTAFECDNPDCKKVATTLTDERPPYGWCHVTLASHTFFDNKKCEPEIRADYYCCSPKCLLAKMEAYIEAAYGNGVMGGVVR